MWRKKNTKKKVITRKKKINGSWTHDNLSKDFKAAVTKTKMRKTMSWATHQPTQALQSREEASTANSALQVWYYYFSIYKNKKKKP